MSDSFLDYVRNRRRQLERELEELRVAERVYLESAGKQAPAGGRGLAAGGFTSPLFDQGLGQRPIDYRAAHITIKDMILTTLGEAHPGGLTSSLLLETIQKRWLPTLERTSLSPQLTRLKNDGLIENDQRLWRLVKSEAASGGS